MISCKIAPQTNCLGDRTVKNIVLPPPCLTGSHFEPFWKRPIAFKKIVCLLFTKKCMVLRVFKLSSTREFLIWMRDASAMVKCQILHPHHDGCQVLSALQKGGQMHGKVDTCANALMCQFYHIEASVIQSRKLAGGRIIILVQNHEITSIFPIDGCKTWTLLSWH